MSLDLKPCAHCGGEGVFGYVDDKDSPDHGGHFVQCVEMRCGASVGLIYNNGEDPKPLLSERWNRRTPDPAITAERDGLREALGRLSVYMIESVIRTEKARGELKDQTHDR